MIKGLTPTSIGPVAAESLSHDGDAEVAAVFDRSVVVMTQFGFVTLGGEPLGDGPLNILLTPNPGPLDWVRLGLTRDAKGSVTSHRLHIGKDFTLDVANAPRWQPPPWPSTTRPKITASLAAIRAHDVTFWPSEGLSRLAIGGSAERSDRTARAAAPTVGDFAKGLSATLAVQSANADWLRAAILLLGLGPGLTPSGDDLLGGVCLTLSALGQTALRDELWETLAPEMELLTTGLSGAHLAAAADGLAAASVHAALAAILSNEAAALAGHLDALRGIGHSSGCDTLAGIVLTLDAALAAGVLA